MPTGLPHEDICVQHWPDGPDASVRAAPLVLRLPLGCVSRVMSAHVEISLLERIADGDEAALSALYDLYYPRLARFLLRVNGGDADGAIEIINDVMFVVWNKAAQFRRDSSLATWIFGIAYRKCVRARSRARMTLSIDDNEPPDHVDRVADIAVDRDFERALAHLSLPQRAVVELTYYFGYSYSEIGRILDCPENTVKTRMFHARRTLRPLLAVTSK